MAVIATIVCHGGKLQPTQVVTQKLPARPGQGLGFRVRNSWRARGGPMRQKEGCGTGRGLVQGAGAGRGRDRSTGPGGP